MRPTGVAAVFAITASLAGCGGDQSAVMPDVTGKKLDVANRAIKDAGLQTAKVEGGGVFGIVTESNWEVCAQTPAAGAGGSEVPNLVVKRSCQDGDDQKKRTPEPESTPRPKKVLTRGNNEDLVALLKVSDECDESIAEFASKYDDRTIRFNGSIVNMALHGDRETRYDFTLAPGGKGPGTTSGPQFKLEDVNTFDLRLKGRNIPDYVREGDRYRFTATVVDYNPDQCLLFLDPVTTRTR